MSSSLTWSKQVFFSPLFFQRWREREWEEEENSQCTHSEIRTRNLRLRRPTPYPLGQAGVAIPWAKILFCQRISTDKRPDDEWSKCTHSLISSLSFPPPFFSFKMVFFIKFELVTGGMYSSQIMLTEMDTSENHSVSDKSNATKQSFVSDHLWFSYCAINLYHAQDMSPTHHRS